MDQIFQTLLSYQFILFGLAISAIMFIIRKTVEYIMQKTKESKFWTDLVLPITPVILGAVGGLVLKQFPYPSGLTTTGSRFVFGLVAGLSSGLIYRILKSMLLDKINNMIPGAIKNSSTPGKPSVDK